MLVADHLAESHVNFQIGSARGTPNLNRSVFRFAGIHSQMLRWQAATVKLAVAREGILLRGRKNFRAWALPAGLFG
jgi:hypothetical protein